MVKYCGKKCQNKHWHQHKVECEVRKYKKNIFITPLPFQKSQANYSSIFVEDVSMQGKDFETGKVCFCGGFTKYDSLFTDLLQTERR